MKPAQPARIHLLPAHEAPFVIVVRRKPSKRFHIIRWNTRTDALEHGSWFHGKLYPMRSDISFDGQWMVYLAMGATGETWNGVCRPPYLKTVVEAPNMGTWFGGGFFSDRYTLSLNQWLPEQKQSPFKLNKMVAEYGGEDLSVLYARWQRDGWRRRGPNFGEHRPLPGPKYRVACDGDDGWELRPSKVHPALLARFSGYLDHGYTFRFELEHHPQLLDERVDSACWDSLGQLVFSRDGVVTKYSLNDLQRGEPGGVIDLESCTEGGDTPSP